MKIEFCVADPAGNITLLVTTPVDKAMHGAIARKLLAIPALKAEQVGFLVPPRMGGMVRLEMMGDEFCGNATRSTALYYAMQAGIHGVIPTEVSGCSALLPVYVEPGAVSVRMPLPLSIGCAPLFGTQAPIIEFEGIAHIIAENREPAEADIQAARAYASNAPAVGVMFFDPTRMYMFPAVYVQGTDSLYYENSCASGSAALAAWLAKDLPDGAYSFSITQPGGCIVAQVQRAKGKTSAISIGGPVSLSGPMEAEV